MSNATPQPPRPGPAPVPQPVAELGALTDLDERPLAEHVAVFDSVHRALSAQLSATES